MKKIVILNDTSSDCHYGCSRVMSNLKMLIEKNGGQIIHSLLLKEKIQNPDTIQHLKEANAVIINGEGTFHHGAKRAFEMLKLVADLPIEKHLVNATYDSNPREFSDLLSKFDSISVRETRSQKQLEKQGVKSIVLPDLSFYSPPISASKKAGYLYGDSTSFNLAWKIHTIFKDRPNYSISQIHFITNQWSQVTKYFIKGIKKFNLTKYKARKIFFTTEPKTPEYFHTEIARTKGIITGRYHSVCFAINSYTPFIAVSSNSHKIEGLIEDIGIDGRLIPPNNLDDLQEIQPFSQNDIAKIKEFLIKGREKTEIHYSYIMN